MNRAVRAALLAGALASLTLGAGGAVAHNAACVVTGNGSVVFVGSNKDGPIVPEQNPNRLWVADEGVYRLDLMDGSGDQYGARWAAEQSPALHNPTKPPCR